MSVVEKRPHSLTILIVDDNPANVRVIVSCLADCGFQVMVARTGEAGLALAQQDQPDLILLDVMPPGIDGFEVCRRLKADERTRGIPVIFMTVLTRVEDKVKGFEVGGVDYIAKPFQEQEVLARVTTHLRLRELTGRLEQKVRQRTGELSKANQAYKALSDCSQALMRATEEGELLQEVCRIILEDCGYQLVWIGLAEHDQAKTVRPVAQAGYLDTVNITWTDTDRGRGPTGTAIRTARPIVNRNILTDPGYAPRRAEAARRVYASSAALPLLTSEGKVIGALNVYATQPDALAPEEIELLMGLAGDLAYGIVVLRARAEHAREEEALRESEALHRITLENILDPVFITADGGQFTFICPNVLHILGYSVEEVRAMGNISHLLGEDLFNLEELEDLGEIYNIERVIADKCGRERIFLITVKRVSIKGGTILYTCHDITEPKRVEEALRESEERFRDLYENAPNAYYSVGSDGLIRRSNRRAAELLGYTAEELLGRPVLELYADTPQGKERVARLLERFQAGEAITDQELQMQPVEGAPRWISLTVNAVCDAQGQVVESRSMVVDITERKRAEKELKKHQDHLEKLVQERTAELTVAKEQALEAQRAAEAANRAKSAFLANMSHELRTPLNAILGYAQILQRRPLATDILDGLKIVQRSGEHLLTLITDILDLSRIEAGRMELSPAPIHFPNFLEHIANIIRARAAAKGLTFSFDPLLGEGLPTWVKADETRLRQVLLNLLDNAVKFTDAGHVTLRVSSKNYKVGSKGREQLPEPLLPAARPYSLLRFEVQDTGIGIPPDQLERIFQPFEQVRDVTRWTKGTGLGLAISRQLVRLMGVELHVASQVGQGSIFWFEVALPVTEVTVEAAGLPEPDITGYKGPRRTVLVVDDVPSNRAVLVDLLRPLGFDVVEAADGQQAIHLAQETRPDLILMDRWMPVLDGFEATRRIRQIPELAGVTIVAVSASVAQQDRVLSREVGLDAFLPKPIRWSNLAALLEEHLGLEWESLAPHLPSAPLLPCQASPWDRSRAKPPRGTAPLVPPPQAEMAVLLDLARQGNMQAVRERAAHVEALGKQYVPFANKLRELAKGFEERELLALVKQYVEGSIL